MTTLSAPPLQPPVGLKIMASRGFAAWLSDQRVSLAVSTYQSGKLFLIGVSPGGRLSVVDRNFRRCMGLWSDGQTLWLAAACQLWRLENVLTGDETADGYDRLFVPRVGHTTGDIDVHDVDVDHTGRVVFVNTLYSCLATVSPRYSFEPLWTPPFISRLAAEDRCHLNGLALQDGTPKYVTVCSRSDLVDGWRDHRVGGGCVIDITDNRLVAEGLSMPHSPRWHEGKLYLLEAGTGWLGTIDVDRGEFHRLTFCPGYARGLSFHAHYAVVGLSKPRRDSTFENLPLDNQLAQRRASPKCGLYVVDLQTGDIVHWLQFDGPVQELYDVVVLPNIRRPKLAGLTDQELSLQRTFPAG